MEFTTVIKERFSCKSYNGQPVEEEKLNEILEAGRVAPTAKNMQAQRVYVIKSAEGLAKVDKATPCRYNAPVVLAVAYDKASAFVYPGGKHTSGEEDASIVATHMMLAAANIGVDSCWLNFFDPELLQADLGIPETQQLVMLLDLGYAAEGAGPLANHTSIKPAEETISYL